MIEAVAGHRDTHGEAETLSRCSAHFPPFFWVYPGFPTIFRGLSGFFVGDLRKRPCGSSWKTRSVFQGAVGALCASTAPSASTGPVRVRQNGSRGGNGELDRRRPRTAVDPWTNVHIQPPICTDRALELSWKDSNIRFRPFGKLGYSLFSLPPIFLGARTTTQKRIRTGLSDTGSSCFSGPADCGSWSMVRLRPGGTPGAGGGTVDRARRGPWALRVSPVAGTAADGARLGPRVAGPPAALSALPGLFVEASVIAPFALVYMAWVISRATSTLLLRASRRADARLLGCPRGSPQQQP